MGRNAAISRESVLRTAAKVFFDKGYGRTTFALVADAAEVQKGSVAYRFGSKENMLIEVIEQNLRDADERVFKKAFTNDRSPLEQLEFFLRLTCEYQKSHPKDLGCFFGRMSLEVADLSELVRLKLKRAFDQYLSHLSFAIVQAQQARQIREDVDPDELAYFILAQMEGAMVLVKTYRDVVRMEQSFDRLITLLAFLRPEGVRGTRNRRRDSKSRMGEAQ